MKLRNKKTGEVVDLSIFGISLSIRKTEQPRAYYSLADLNEEWEDYEEPSAETMQKLKDILDELRKIAANTTGTFYWVDADGKEHPISNIDDELFGRRNNDRA